MIGTVVTTDWL